MIKHARSEIGIDEDEYAVSIGLRGLRNGTICQAVLQASKTLEEQDFKLGLDTLYIEYETLSGYGLVQSVRLLENKVIEVYLKSKIPTDEGAGQDLLIFEHDGKISEIEFEKIALICKLSRTQIAFD